MNLGIVGSRNYIDYNDFSIYIDEWIRENGKPKLIVSGGARGADTLAEKYAENHNIEILIFPADWDKYGKAAGPIRNKKIVENSDCIIAFLSKTSRGTLNTVSLAEKHKKKIVKIDIDIQSY